MTDFAVVVGVSRYPELSTVGAAADLEGPDNDAQGIQEWLVDPEGGRLDPVNVKVIRSADHQPLDPDDPQPAAAKVVQALKWVEKQTRAAAGGRLYLYFSGHGFAPVLEEGALFTAEATQVSPSYVYAHSWLRWFRTAQRFRESVLWMDCCMDFQRSIPVQEAQMRPQIGTGVPGPAFVALAAQTKSALEATMPDGRVHGVFTWTLLRGLRGGACDERGRVTGQSLKTFLHAVMPEFLPDSVRRAGVIDLQPFVRADEGMTFTRLPARPKCRVHLTLPGAAAGKELRIWTGRPTAQVLSETLAGQEWTGALVRGLYVAEVPAARLRHGFQVSGAGDVEIAVTRSGEPVVASDPSALFSLDVVGSNQACSIAVLDHRFDRIFSETGELHEREMPGVYKVRVEFGRDITSITDEVVLLDRDLQVGKATEPRLSSPAPIPGSRLTHEYHMAPFGAAADRQGHFRGPAPGMAAISVMSRYWTSRGAPRKPGLSFAHPMQGLVLVDGAGIPVADLSAESRADQRADIDPVAVWEREIPPGPAYLRQALPGGRTYEGCIVASPDWVTQVAVRRAGAEATNGGQAAWGNVIGDLAVFMRRAGGGPREPDQDATIEAARMALSQGRNLFSEGRGAQLKELLLHKYTDPIAGIIGAHLLLRAVVADKPDPARADLFDTAVANLRRLVGPEHPDVEALSLKCADTAQRATRPFSVPPMFSHSWQLITEASYQQPDLVPGQLWQRVHAAANVGPFFVWAADPQTKAAHAQQLTQWISGYAHGAALEGASAPSQLPDSAREAGRRLQVPAAATEALWGDSVRTG